MEPFTRHTGIGVPLRLSNVDTDQIIPAQYLTYNPSIPAEYKMFGKFALAGVPDDAAGLPKGHVPFHGPADEFVSPYAVIIAGKNFGCGSSREHAPIALAAAGIAAVVSVRSPPLVSLVLGGHLLIPVREHGALRAFVWCIL